MQIDVNKQSWVDRVRGAVSSVLHKGGEAMARGKDQQEESRGRSSGREMTRAGGTMTRAPYWATTARSGSPFAMMRRFAEDMDRLFESFDMGPSAGGQRQDRWLDQQLAWAPQVEVFERGKKIVVRADLPGVKQEDIRLQVTDDALVIQGERKSESETREEGFYTSELSYGSFQRTIPLPDGADPEKANATFRNGVLEIEIEAPAMRSRAGRRIEIREGTQGAEKTIEPKRGESGEGKAAGVH